MIFFSEEDNTCPKYKKDTDRREMKPSSSCKKAFIEET